MKQGEPVEILSSGIWLKRVAVFLAIIFCAYQFGFKPLYEKYEEQWYTQNEDGNKKVLSPGFQNSFWYEVPEGYVGVLIDKRTRAVQSEPLLPGKHYINPKLYDMTTVYTEKQTWQFGGKD